MGFISLRISDLGKNYCENKKQLTFSLKDLMLNTYYYVSYFVAVHDAIKIIVIKKLLLRVQISMVQHFIAKH